VQHVVLLVRPLTDGHTATRSQREITWSGARKEARRREQVFSTARATYVGDEEPNMKKLLSPGVVSLLFAMATLWGSTLSGGQDRGINEGIRGRFIGAWRLGWLEEEDADGSVHCADCTGMLVFAREGRMSVQVMYR